MTDSRNALPMVRTWHLPWMADGNCASVDPDLWFPDRGGSARDVKAICRGCEVIDRCLQYALTNRERYGIWGGKSEMERQKLLKEQAA